MQKSECHGGVQLRNRVTGTECCFLNEEADFVNNTLCCADGYRVSFIAFTSFLLMLLFFSR